LEEFVTEDQMAAEARELLANVTRVQSHARQSMLSASWSIFILWGVISAVSVVPLLLGADDIGYYWLVAAPIGAIASFWLGARHSEDVGAGESSLPYALTAIGIFVFAFAGSILIDSRWAIVWVFSVVAVGFGVFAILDRQQPVLYLVGLLVVAFVGLGLGLDDSTSLYLSCALLLGGSYLGLGVGLRMARP
jgi:hypothetical protein